MSYQVLARKWRPRRFQEMVGQRHVLRALVHALNEKRLHHAYLFCGTRGVGKTTLARILAKALNCERGISAEPCGTCAACREIDEGRFVDLIEVDAASRTRVEDTRELLENVPYTPAKGRYKVYLIDEVHMLSAHSFNALLKTLEEPPAHVKFLLATTDPQKVPVTVLSRCLQFNLKPLAERAIQRHLARVLEAEGIPHEEDALLSLAQAARGSVRDALSLLDQAIAFGGGEVRGKDVQAMLGTVGQGEVRGLVEALAQGDARSLLTKAEAMADEGVDLEEVLGEIAALFQRMALAREVPEMGDAGLKALAERFSPEDIQLHYQIALLGRRDLPLAPTPRVGFEMALLRMLAFQPEGPVPEAREEGWETIVARLPLRGVSRELAHHLSLEGREGNAWRFALAPSHAHLLTEGSEQRFREAMEKTLGQVRVSIRVAEVGDETPAARRDREEAMKRQGALESIRQDPKVHRILEAFSAEVLEAKPLEERRET